MTQSNREFDKRLVEVRPSERQLEYQKLEFVGFIHYNVNTYTGREWGDGKESPAMFNPTNLDALQWVQSMKAAGINLIILTCKHHDGFCLWPSAYTEHSIASSPYKDGKGDLVKEVSEACAQEGIKFGVYLSPWDRNQKVYGYGEAYDDYFCNQLTELLTNYGPVYTVWLDGACGEGANGKKQYYNFPRYYKLIRELQPKACINVCGPDIRWCGNEAGDTRPSEWSVVPEALRHAEYVESHSQQEDNAAFRVKKISSMDRDLGSRGRLRDVEDLIWYPAEVNTSIRPGWFYHEEEDDKVKSLNQLVRIYEKAIGGNAIFLLNVPPNKEGRIADQDVKRLKELGDYFKHTFRENIAENATFRVNKEKAGYEIDNVRDMMSDKWYMPEDGETSVEIEIEFEKKEALHYLVMQEHIQLSQRIEDFQVYAKVEDRWIRVYKGTTVGYKKIVRLHDIETNMLKIQIKDSRVCPTLHFVGVYKK